MKINLAPGRYVLAVSGGVDSMTLLDLLVKQAKNYQLKAKSSASSLELVVAHFNHGIRLDSYKDEHLVRKSAKEYGLPFEVGYGNLSSKASEEEARQARYKFLEKIKKKHRAKSIVTAHHQDDLIETAFINILRGTGRRGLTSIRNQKVLRPLLNVSKVKILEYAKSKKLTWRDDPTNKEDQYLRNYLRQKIMPRLTFPERQKLISNLDKVAKINEILNNEIATLSHNKQELDRQEFINLPADVGSELLVYWLRQNDIRDFDHRTISRLATAIKTGLPGTQHEVVKGKALRLTKGKAVLV